VTIIMRILAGANDFVSKQFVESPHPVRADVEGQLERILANPLFQTSQRLSRFLRFAVESVLGGGRANQRKESVIGVEVFGLRVV
jgi:hypothetical protein